MCKSEIFAEILNIVGKETEVSTELILSSSKVTEVVDARTGLGEAEYSKCDFTLDQAIEDQINWKME